MIASLIFDPLNDMWGRILAPRPKLNHPLKKTLCLKCLQWHSGIDISDGIIPMLMSACSGHTVEYNPGNFKRRHLTKMMMLLDGLPDKTDLETMINYAEFPHLKGVDTDMMSELDIMLYQYAREAEIKMIKRIRHWMHIENEFDKTW